MLPGVVEWVVAGGKLCGSRWESQRCVLNNEQVWYSRNVENTRHWRLSVHLPALQYRDRGCLSMLLKGCGCGE